MAPEPQMTGANPARTVAERPAAPPPSIVVPLDLLDELLRAGLANVDGAETARRILGQIEERVEPAGELDSRALSRATRAIERLATEARRIKPRMAMPSQLQSAIAALVRACLHYAPTATAARGPVAQLQLALARLGNDDARRQSEEIGKLLANDARRRRMKQTQPTADGIGPTPETQAKLRRDTIERLFDDQKLNPTQYGAAMEIRDLADRIISTEHGKAKIVTVRVDISGVGPAPVERLADLLSSTIGRRYLAWQRRMAARPAGEGRRSGGSMLDLVRAVLVDNLTLGEAAQRVQVRKGNVVPLLIAAINDYVYAPDEDRQPEQGQEAQQTSRVTEEYLREKRLATRAAMEREGRTTYQQRRRGGRFVTYPIRPLADVGHAERFAIYRAMCVDGALKLAIAEQYRLDPGALTTIWYEMHPVFNATTAAEAWWKQQASDAPARAVDAAADAAR